MCYLVFLGGFLVFCLRRRVNHGWFVAVNPQVVLQSVNTPAQHWSNTHRTGQLLATYLLLKLSLSLSPPLSLYLNLCINYASCVYNHSCYLALFSVLWISITNTSLLCKCKITSYFYEIFKCWCICFSFFFHLLKYLVWRA